MTWLEGAPGVLAFARTAAGEQLVCQVNLSGADAAVPRGELLHSSGPLPDDGRMPANTTVWVRQATAG
jgi:alpha-glucosidase